MALCPKCSFQIAQTATRCVECGYDFPESDLTRTVGDGHLVGSIGIESTVVGDSMLMGGAIACGGAG